jgi:hypothetical protein
MGLMDTVRNAVAIADGLTKDLQPAVLHTAVLDSPQTLRGEQVAPQAAVARRAIVEQKQRLVRTTAGDMALSKAKVTFLSQVAIGLRDKIVLPDGSTGPILETEGFIDSATARPILSEVYLG